MGDLPDPGRRFLQHHHVGVPGQLQQVGPVQVGLDPRRVVVEAHRHVGAVEDLERRWGGHLRGLEKPRTGELVSWHPLWSSKREFQG